MRAYPLFNVPTLTECSLSCRDAIGDTAVALAETPELSTHFLGKTAKASWSVVKTESISTLPKNIPTVTRHYSFRVAAESSTVGILEEALMEGGLPILQNHLNVCLYNSHVSGENTS